jgi:hypothetical protein
MRRSESTTWSSTNNSSTVRKDDMARCGSSCKGKRRLLLPCSAAQRMYFCYVCVCGCNESWRDEVTRHENCARSIYSLPVESTGLSASWTTGALKHGNAWESYADIFSSAKLMMMIILESDWRNTIRSNWHLSISTIGTTCVMRL